MSKFKVGDKVVRRVMDLGHVSDIHAKSLFERGAILTVSFIADVGDAIRFKEIEGLWCRKNFKLYEDYAKHHKHHDLIIAWAKGAEIEHLVMGNWYPASSPSWFVDVQYRIKPTEIDVRQQEIDHIESEMRKLADQLNELKNN